MSSVVIETGSGVNADGQAFVQVFIDGKKVCVLEPDEARRVAGHVMEAAASADADAMLLHFFREKGFPEAAYAAVLAEWRQFKRESEGLS